MRKMGGGVMRSEENAKVTVNIDVNKIVRSVSIAGVVIVGIVIGCSAYKKQMELKRLF